MVGRVLPNSRPNGEDHRGADGGGQMGMLRRTDSGAMTPECRNLTRIRTRTRIHKALGFLQSVGLAL